MKKDVNVYVVDDEKICVDEVLEETDWDALGISKECVYGATSARMVRQYLRADQPGIILCDVEMPGESGLEFVEWASEWARFSIHPLVIVMLTCHPEYQYIRKAMQLGCIDYVLKPIVAEELNTVLKKCLHTISEIQKNYSILSKRVVIPTHEDLVQDKILPFIMEHLQESISIEDIAEFVGLNPQYMMRLFKKQTGKSILQFITEKRLQIAKEYLLKTDETIESITEKIGYFSVAHFSQVFKKNEGVSPGQFRTQNR